MSEVRLLEEIVERSIYRIIEEGCIHTHVECLKVPFQLFIGKGKACTGNRNIIKPVCIVCNVVRSLILIIVHILVTQDTPYDPRNFNSPKRSR